MTSPQGYGPQAFDPGFVKQQTNGLAIASLVCSLLGFFTAISVIPGIVLGHVARGQIKQNGQAGGGLALAGLIIGYSLLAVFVVALAFLFLIVAAFANG